MANANPSRAGQINSQGDTLALFLKVFSGETLTAYERSTFFKSRHNVRSISSGKSAQFPAFGRIDGYMHVPGDEILGNKLNAAERVIAIEGMYVAPAFIANIDEAFAHYDYRAPIARQIGENIAVKYDEDVAREFINAARVTVPTVNGVFPGDVLASQLINAAYANDGSVIFQGIYDADTLMDQRDLPTDGRFAAFRPVQYNLLIKSEKPFDYRLNDGKTGLGGYAEGAVRMVAGIPVFKTNRLINSDDRTNAGQPTARQHDYSVTQGLVAHSDAVGSVNLMDVQTESAWDIRRQGWLTLGKYAAGHGTLRPEAAIELASAAAAG